MMTSVEVVRQMAAGKQVLLERESIHAMADILVCRKYKKGEIILNEGEVCECMRYIEKGMTRQFYFKYDKDVTEHIGYERRNDNMSGKLSETKAYSYND